MSKYKTTLVRFVENTDRSVQRGRAQHARNIREIERNPNGPLARRRRVQALAVIVTILLVFVGIISSLANHL